MAQGNPRVFVEDTLNLGLDAIMVRVGPDAKQFYVHTDLIRAQSAFFQAALSHDWKESTEQIVTLPEDDPTAFELYLTWLYTQKIASKPRSGDEDRYKEYSFLAKCVVLGEKLQDVRFKNALVDAILAVTEDRNEKGVCWYPINRPLYEIYEGTPPNAPVRRLLVDMWAWHGHEGWLSLPNSQGGRFTQIFSLRPGH